MTSFYNLVAKSIDGKEIAFSTLKDKVVLVVNVASKCGFTDQYKQLEDLYQKFKQTGKFEILGFPCNQFGFQEPGSNEEIKSFCSTKYQVSFPMFEKINVNGNNTHPVYEFLKSQKSGILGITLIKWNFEKFLIDKKGEVYERYASTKSPLELEAEVEKLINK